MPLEDLVCPLCCNEAHPHCGNPGCHWWDCYQCGGFGDYEGRFALDGRMVPLRKLPAERPATNLAHGGVVAPDVARPEATSCPDCGKTLVPDPEGPWCPRAQCRFGKT